MNNQTKVIDALGSQGGEGQAAVTIPFQDVSYTPTRALYETDALQVLSCSVLASQETVADVFAAHIRKKKKKESEIYEETLKTMSSSFWFSVGLNADLKRTQLRTLRRFDEAKSFPGPRSRILRKQVANQDILFGTPAILDKESKTTYTAMVLHQLKQGRDWATFVGTDRLKAISDVDLDACLAEEVKSMQRQCRMMKQLVQTALNPKFLINTLEVLDLYQWFVKATTKDDSEAKDIEKRFMEHAKRLFKACKVHGNCGGLFIIWKDEALALWKIRRTACKTEHEREKFDDAGWPMLQCWVEGYSLAQK